MNKKISISGIDILNLIFWIFMFVFFVLAFNKTDHKLYGSILLSLLLFFQLFVLYTRDKQNKNVFFKYLHILYPAIFLIFIFDCIHTSLPYINPNDYDAYLANLDFKLLGTHPTVAIEKIISPLLTEIMYILYFFYFFMPFTIIIYFLKKKYYQKLDKTVLFLLLTFYGSYLLYYLVPALGPRHYEPIVDMQSVPLNGLLFTDFIRNTVDTFEHNKFDAFPSLHAAISLSVLIVIAKYKKSWLYVFIPIVTGIFVSLIYCRYHYFIDIIGGVLWTLISYLIVELFYNKLYSKYFSPYYTGK